MKPGKLDLPDIWRGCDWGPVIFRWKDVNGDPIRLDGWTPTVQSLNVDLKPSITDVGQGVTQLALNSEETAILALGSEAWDWIWQRNQGQYRFPPFLSGKVIIRDPISPTKGEATILIPPIAPVATAATQVAFDSFNANWERSDRATGYRLDVASNIEFTTFVPGFRDLGLGDVNRVRVTGLLPLATYYYRVRAFNIGGHSDSSNVITVTTPVTPPPANNNRAASIRLLGLAGSTNGSTEGATREPGEPDGENSVWYKWASPSGGVISVWRLNTNVSKMDVYREVADSLVLVASSVGTPPAMTFLTDVEVTFYYVRVFKDSDTGPFTLTWSYSI